MGDKWQILTAVSAAMGTIVFGFSAYILVRQLDEIRRATVAGAFSTALSFIQSDEMRSARKRAFKLNPNGFDSWTPEQIADVSRVCNGFECVSIMIKEKMIPSRLIAANWRHSLQKTWKVAQPLVALRRSERGEDYWVNFERLVNSACTANERALSPEGLGTESE